MTWKEFKDAVEALGARDDDPVGELEGTLMQDDFEVQIEITSHKYGRSLKIYFVTADESEMS